MQIERWAAFTTDPRGGNPAGVVLDAGGADEAAMQRVAREVGYSETAFVTGRRTDGARSVRYFTPLAEIPFCGHATLATALAIATADGPGPIAFATSVGRVEIVTSRDDDRGLRASFTSVEPATRPLTDAMLADILGLIGLAEDDLDARFPPMQAYAGNWHPVIVVAGSGTFDRFGFDPARARAVLDAHGWPATITVLHRTDDEHWDARNLFPVGDITEDPATGAAAAATGGYLRELGAVPASGRVRIAQGHHVGRPSELVLDIPATGGIVVSGRGVPDPV